MLATPQGNTYEATKELEIAFLKCKVEPSAFPHEVGVLIRGLNQGYESLIDSDLVQAENCNDGQTHSGRVEIAIIQRDERRNALLVELPRQVVMGGRRIWVPESEVEQRNPHEHSLSKGNQKTPQ